MYKLNQNSTVTRLSDGACIPLPANESEGWKYEQWLSEGNTPLPADLPTPTQIQSEIVAATQARLDDFARSRGYDGILSACTYATSGVPKFAAEGQYCVGARDATWGTLYTVLSEVQAGTRPMPTGFADVEPLLPALVWPA